jgi:hypothetical protein
MLIIFPLVKTLISGHPAEHGIGFDVVMAAPVHTNRDLKAVFPRQLPDERDAEGSKERPGGNGLFWSGKQWKLVDYPPKSGAKATAVQTLRECLGFQTSRSVWTAARSPPLLYFADDQPLASAVLLTF